jgi:hypothetical protein
MGTPVRNHLDHSSSVAVFALVWLPPIGVPALYLVLLSRIRHRINPSGVTLREAVRRRQSDDRVSPTGCL